MAELCAIVPTRDRGDVLRDCLATLAKQDVQAGRLEVVVVDDGSRDDLAPFVTAASSPAVPMRCRRQRCAGLNAARNLGASSTDAPVLAFLDDDTLVAPRWADALLRSFSEARCTGAAGRVRLRFEGPVPVWLTSAARRFMSEFELGPASHELGPGDPLPVGANCALRRDAFERVGGFRAGLDREGESLVSNGEVELFQRVRAGGGNLCYVADAEVEHRVPAARLTREWLQRRAFAQGVSDELLLGDRGRSPLALREHLRLARVGPILARNLLTSGGTTNARLWVAYCRGRRGASKRVDA